MSNRKRARFPNLPSEIEKMPENMVRLDPVGKHTIALRECHRALIKYKQKVAANKPPGPVPSLPEFPIDYPTHDFLKELRRKRNSTYPQLVFKSHFSESDITEKTTSAIKSILMQIGYDAENMNENDAPLKLLSHVVDSFMKSFIKRLRYHKNSEAFGNSKDLWDSVDTTLQDLRFNGVRGIAEYYYDEFIEMNSALYNECNIELKKINARAPVQNKSPDCTVSKDETLAQDMPPDYPLIENAIPILQDMPPDYPMIENATPILQDMPPDYPMIENAPPILQDMPPDYPMIENAIPILQDLPPDYPMSEVALSLVRDKSPDCAVSEDAMLAS